MNYMIVLVFFFFFKQKTAYEISSRDWSSDVCSSDLDDDTDLTAALRSAIDDVLSHAVAFSPTFVTVQTARLVGDRVYILLLIGDADGEETIKTMMKSSSDADDENELK